MDKMREEFEAWYAEQFKYSDKRLSRHGETYLSPFVGGLWSSWKASRAALCVELPDFSKHKDGGEWWAGYTCAVSDVKSGLNQIGVTCK